MFITVISFQLKPNNAKTYNDLENMQKITNSRVLSSKIFIPQKFFRVRNIARARGGSRVATVKLCC